MLIYQYIFALQQIYGVFYNGKVCSWRRHAKENSQLDVQFVYLDYQHSEKSGDLNTQESKSSRQVNMSKGMNVHRQTIAVRKQKVHTVYANIHKNLHVGTIKMKEKPEQFSCLTYILNNRTTKKTYTIHKIQKFMRQDGLCNTITNSICTSAQYKNYLPEVDCVG